MSLSYNRSAMLDYVKGRFGRQDYEVEGEFIPEPQEEPEPYEYNGEFRYVNLGPAKVRRLLETEKDPRELQALETARRYWAMKSPMEFDPSNMGWVHRGEPRQAIQAESMAQLASEVKPVQHIFLQGALTTEAPYGGTQKNWELGSIIDFDSLVGMAPNEPMDEIGMMIEYDVDELASGF